MLSLDRAKAPGLAMPPRGSSIHRPTAALRRRAPRCETLAIKDGEKTKRKIGTAQRAT